MLNKCKCTHYYSKQKNIFLIKYSKITISKTKKNIYSLFRCENSVTYNNKEIVFVCHLFSCFRVKKFLKIEHSINRINLFFENSFSAMVENIAFFL